jgi:hypothetical protein
MVKQNVTFYSTYYVTSLFVQSLAATIAPSITICSITCTIRRSHDPPLAQSVALSIARWSTPRTIHRSFCCSLIHRLHHLSHFILLSDPSLAPSIASSIDLWSITCTIHRFSYCSLIHRLHHQSLLLAEPPLAPSIAPSSSSIGRIIHRSF